MNLKICQEKECLYLQVFPRMKEDNGFFVVCAATWLSDEDSQIGYIPGEVKMKNGTLEENQRQMNPDSTVINKDFQPPADCPYKLEHLMEWKR